MYFKSHISAQARAVENPDRMKRQFRVIPNFRMVCRQLERYLANNNLRRRSKSGCYLPNSRLPQFSYFLCNAGSANGSICFCRNQRLRFSLSKLPLHLTVIVELFMWIERTQLHSRAFPAHCQSLHNFIAALLVKQVFT